MVVTEALLAGGFALAGVAAQQTLSWANDHRKFQREVRNRQDQEEHQAFVDLVKAGRRVQRALIDVDESPESREAARALSDQVDALTEAVVVLRLVVADRQVIDAAETFEGRAKALEKSGGSGENSEPLQLTPMLEALRSYEAERRGR